MHSLVSHTHDFSFFPSQLTQGEMEEAAVQLATCVNDDGFFSPKGTTKHALWMRLCDMCAKHPQAVSRRLKVDAIIRSGLARFTDETGAGHGDA